MNEKAGDWKCSLLYTTLSKLKATFSSGEKAGKILLQEYKHHQFNDELITAILFERNGSWFLFVCYSKDFAIQNIWTGKNYVSRRR